jgi:NhaP-type Na+/H+ or K+/H+ antiporter
LLDRAAAAAYLGGQGEILHEYLLIGLAAIIALGIGAQWLAWRLHLPAILLLLISGVVAGPVVGLLNPDELFGDLLFPLVSVSVAIILFEGGLNLRFRELRGVGRVVFHLATYGVLVTWLLTSVIAWLLLGMSWPTAVLLGAVLVVSGPTVILPLLRQVRPSGRIGPVVKWEGIINDPLGAILAVIVFELIVAGGTDVGSAHAVLSMAAALVYGSLVGLAGAAVIMVLLRRYLIPDFLQNPVSLMVVVLCYATADSLQSESGLLAVTIMGLVLANQRYVSVKHITEFKEDLRVILISSLFIILAARLPLEDGRFGDVAGWIFVAALILVVRPAATLAATLRSKLKRAERVFLGWMAPRGIVAAAVASVFAIRLEEMNLPGSEQLVPVTFQVIIGTVAVYGLTSLPLARRLKLAKPNPQGLLLVGAHRWARAIAEKLTEEQFPVRLIDTNWANVTAARNMGLAAHLGNVLSENLQYEMQLDGIGRLLALTPNDDVNSLAALHFVDLFGRVGVYQLPPGEAGTKNARPEHLRGRYLFDSEATSEVLNRRVRAGDIIKKHSVTEEFKLDDLRTRYGTEALPLFTIGESGDLRVCTADSEVTLKPGEAVISLVTPSDEPT